LFLGEGPEVKAFKLVCVLIHDSLPKSIPQPASEAGKAEHNALTCQPFFFLPCHRHNFYLSFPSHLLQGRTHASALGYLSIFFSHHPPLHAPTCKKDFLDFFRAESYSK
jgi:hypothetical protein